MIDRLIGGLAPNIPQGDIDTGIAPDLGPGAGETHIAGQCLGMIVNAQRILAQQVLGGETVNMGLGRGNTVEDFTQASQAFIGMHQNPQQIGEFLQPNGLDRGDFHL